jgi:ssDNA-binding Zn-finger/Zn-ribbon topoisomerase 1
MASNNKFRKSNTGFLKTGSRKIPQPGREAEHDEYGQEHKGVTECPECHNVHFKKRWHRSIHELNTHVKSILQVNKKVICRACKMTQDHLFEGELFIEECPERHEEELLRLIHNVGKRAQEMDPQHRIINIGKTDQGAYRVTTTENQLADRLAKKIKAAFNTVGIHLSHSKEPYKVDRIHVTFHSQ